MIKLIDDIRRDNIALLVDEFGSLIGLANRLEKDSSQVSQWLHGSIHSVTGKKRGLRSASARYIEEKCSKPTGWLDVPHDRTTPTVIEPAPTPPQEGVVFYQLDVEAACGEGRQNRDYPEIVRAIVLSDAEARERIGSINKSGSIQVIVATGDSMTPTIQPRDLLFVDTAVTEFSGDGVYLIRRDHGLSCKRLSMAGRTLLVTSDNPVARDWKWKDKRESDAIIGRVLAALPMTFKQFY
jgi:phage repressor protein C with HTH and peptisase S24 domain